MSIWDLPDFPSGIFDTETITLKPRLASSRGTGGAPGAAFGDPVTMAAQVDAMTGDLAVRMGVADIVSVYAVRLSVDPGEDFDEGTIVTGIGPGPAVVIKRMDEAPNEVVLAVQGRR